MLPSAASFLSLGIDRKYEDSKGPAQATLTISASAFYSLILKVDSYSATATFK